MALSILRPPGLIRRFFNAVRLYPVRHQIAVLDYREQCLTAARDRDWEELKQVRRKRQRLQSKLD